VDIPATIGSGDSQMLFALFVAFEKGSFGVNEKDMVQRIMTMY
jgi:hypothetical protein